jgi:hypothetical protein
MTDQPIRRLSGEEIVALKFAAHRQLSRWSKKPTLSPHQHPQRNALKRAVRSLEDKALAAGCELHAISGEPRVDA